LVVNEVISHAAATSFIHIVKFAASQASHNIRKTGSRKGASAAASKMRERENLFSVAMAGAA
jgi:hypothetical protein